MQDQRKFIVDTLRDMEGNALLLLATGRTEPTDIAPHGKLIVNSPHWFKYPQELDLMVEFAEKERKGEARNTYISPIIYGDEPYVSPKTHEVVRQDRAGRPLYSRSKSNALFAQTIYMDSDACPPGAFRIKPSRHVQTSEGHGHDYWYLTNPVPATVASEIAHRITTAHKDEGSDPSGWSSNKVLRLPSWNTTYDTDNPYEIKSFESKEALDGELYDASDISGAYDNVEVDTVADHSLPLTAVPKIEGLPDFETLVARIPAAERRLNDLIYKDPGDKGWRSEQRFALLLDLQRFGFNDEETVAIAWHSPAAAKWRVDARGVDGLWWELQVKVKAVLAEESGAAISAAPAMERRTHEIPELLSPQQRARVERRQDTITLYLQYAREKVQNANMPYHIINAWTYLALALSEVVEMPKEPRALGTGLYSFTLGKSSSGKDESMSVLMPCVYQLYPSDHIEIPANSSKEMLVENLIDRSDKVSFIRENEADALLAQVKSGYLQGIEKYWTRSYDGEVPGLGRVGKKELNKPTTHAIPIMHFMGTPSGILNTLDKSMFHSGWLARQIWVIGDDVKASESTLKSKFRRGDAAVLFDGMPKYLGTHFMLLRNRLRSQAPLDHKRASLEPTDEAIELHDKMHWKLLKHVGKDYEMDLWNPVVNRMGDIMWKLAALVAASDGRTVVGTADVEVGVYYVETWIANTMTVADGISDTFFSKQCDDIEKFVASREKQEADIGAIYRFRKGEPKRVTDEFLQSLTYQGRLHVPREGYYKIKEGKTA